MILNAWPWILLCVDDANSEKNLIKNVDLFSTICIVDGKSDNLYSDGIGFHNIFSSGFMIGSPETWSV